MRIPRALLLVCVALLLPLIAFAGGEDEAGDVIKVGVLHSLSGTMSISEVAVKDATILAINEINAAGGVLGKQIVPIIEDGASDWPTFAEKARKLIERDQVQVVFGCWTSASRKAVLPVFEGLDHLLFYPVQYEGLEASKNIIYTGAAPNQQIMPAVSWLLREKGTDFFLLGSDYVFPRTANKIIKIQLEAEGGTTVAEEYTPLGHTEYATVINKIQAANPDVIFNTLNGDSNVAFFKQLKAAGIGPEDIPVMSVSVAEEEIKGIGAQFIEGHLAAWNYFQSMDSPKNAGFVERYKAAYGADRVTDDPIEAGYFGVYLWAEAVQKAGTADTAGGAHGAARRRVRGARGHGQDRPGEQSHLEDRPDRSGQLRGPVRHPVVHRRAGAARSLSRADLARRGRGRARRDGPAGDP